MTPVMNWKNIEIDHVKPTCPFDIFNIDELKEAFCRKNTQTFLKQINQQKRTEYKFLDCQIQFIKANHFIKLNEARLKETIQC